MTDSNPKLTDGSILDELPAQQHQLQPIRTFATRNASMEGPLVPHKASTNTFLLALTLTAGCSSYSATTILGNNSDAGTNDAGTSTGGKSSNGGSTVAVSSSVGGMTGTGGFGASAGASATGGGQSQAGASATGGSNSTGGASPAAGATATGGVASTGGSAAIGGSTSTGGAPATGGSSGTGGAPSTGGTAATGGIATTGGTTSAPLMAKAVATGYQHSCAIVRDGTVQCWGSNSSGQLGNNSNTDSLVPVTVVGISTAFSIAAGIDFTCATLADGYMKCWGGNQYGQLGNGTQANSPAPADVSGIFANAIAVSVASNGYHACALLSSGNGLCWGNGQQGQLGNGASASSSTPVAFSIPANQIASLVAGNVDTCATLLDGTIRCAGYNSNGQLLGINELSSSSTPVAQTGVTNSHIVVTGSDETCTILNDSSLECCGMQVCGNGCLISTGGMQAVTGISNATAITAGSTHFCVLQSGGSTKCFGGNSYGQLGLGNTIAYSVPTLISSLTDVSSISGGVGHTCAVTASGSVYCWGWNANGQLGTGDTADSLVPVEVSGF